MPDRRCRASVSPALLLLLGSLAAAPVRSAEPGPFRLDAALAGRSFQYNTESFLHRWSYRQGFPLLDAAAADGFHGSAGSVRASEFHSVMRVQHTAPLGTRHAFRFSWQRDEDFDGNWDQTWIGAGRELGAGWQAWLYGDVPGDKEFVDARVDLAWTGTGEDRARIALVAPDFQYNAKQTAARYAGAPLTLFAERRWALADDGVLHGLVERNLPVTWREAATGLRLDDARTRAIVAWRTGWADGRRWSFAFEGEQGARRTRDLTLDDALRRTHGAATLQLDLQPGADGEARWLGLRILQLRETTAHATPAPTRLARDEVLVYLGRSWALGPTLSFRPELILDRVASRDDAAARPRQDALLGKLTLPFEWRVDAARIVVMPTVKLHEFAFGGAAVQLAIPF